MVNVSRGSYCGFSGGCWLSDDEMSVRDVPNAFTRASVFCWWFTFWSRGLTWTRNGCNCGWSRRKKGNLKSLVGQFWTSVVHTIHPFAQQSGNDSSLPHKRVPTFSLAVILMFFFRVYNILQVGFDWDRQKVKLYIVMYLSAV